MRSSVTPRRLECHAFVCQSPEDAIVIAATLYQCLMSHMSVGGLDDRSGGKNKKIRKPRNENGVSCISIASSSVGGGGANRFGSITTLSLRQLEAFKTSSELYPPRPPRKKRSASSTINGHSGNTNRMSALSDEDQRRGSGGYGEDGKKKSHKTKRAPPIPSSYEGKRNLSILIIRKFAETEY